MHKFGQFLLISIFTSSSLFSQEQNQAQVESRQMSLESRAAWEEILQPQESQEESQASADPSLEQRSQRGFFQDNSPTSSYVFHWISELAYLSDTLVMEDGSVWHINHSDRNTLKTWKISDPLVITQAGWFSSNKYKIVNKNSNTSVDANLSLGSTIDGQYSHRIIEVDRNRGEIVLGNGSRWNISYGDRNILADWLNNDTIIIGMNTAYFSGGDFLLIDVEANSFVKANLIQNQNPCASHWISELSPLSDTLVMEDGSIWQISPSDRALLSGWKKNDLIVITQSGYFSGYTYKIMNKSVNNAVAANLGLGSIIGGKYSHRIVEINPFIGEILLENGFHWRVPSSDVVLLRDWKINDTIIVGINTRFFSSGEFILIDVEVNNYVKTNLVQ